MNLSNTVLLIDDDREILELIQDFLTKENFVVKCCDDSREAINLLHNEAISLVVTDLMMPFINGLQLSTMIREFSKIPIIMLTCIDDDIEKVAALESTVDNYLVKPINLKVLSAEIKRLLAKKQIFSNTQEVITYKEIVLKKEFYRFGDIVLDTNTQTIHYKDEAFVLTSGEYNLLITFLKRPMRTLSRDQLLDLTDNEDKSFMRSIDVLISRLRKKIPSQQPIIKTIKNLGYRFDSKVIQYEQEI